MRLLLTRHPQCEFNVAGKFQGVSDSPYTELGKLQLGSLAIKLLERGYDLSRVVVYPHSLRLYSCATVLAEALRVSVVPNENFAEVNYGRWEGRNKFECQDTDSELYALFMSNPMQGNLVFPEGERVSNVFTRVYLGIREMGLDQDTLIVGSNFFLQVMYVTLTGMDPPKRFPQCSLTVLRDRPGLSLFEPELVADESHLRDLQLR